MAEKAFWVEVTYKDPNMRPKQWRFLTENLRKLAMTNFSRDKNVKNMRTYRAK